MPPSLCSWFVVLQEAYRGFPRTCNAVLADSMSSHGSRLRPFADFEVVRTPFVCFRREAQPLLSVRHRV